MEEQLDIFTSLERKNYNSNIHPQIFELLDKQYKQLSQSVKADIQLLLGKNSIAGNNILDAMSESLSETLIENGEIIDSIELNKLVKSHLKQVYNSESERLFKDDYTIIKDITDILKDRMKYILGMYLYQDCMVELDELVNQYSKGTIETKHNINMDKKISGLTYQLARNYKLHRDMKLYMIVNHIVDEYKKKLIEQIEDSLYTLRIDHLDYIGKLKDSICHSLQEYQFEQYEKLAEEYSDLEKHLS